MKKHVATLLLVAGMVTGLAAFNAHFVPNRAAAEQKKEKAEAEKQI